MVYLANLFRGELGAVSSGHALATEAALRVLADGGCAIDAMICAQAVICVAMPQAAGLGGDMLMLVRDSQSKTLAINGTGKSGKEFSSPSSGSGASVTVPGLASGWAAARSLRSNLSMERILAPAIALATKGYQPDGSLIRARDAHLKRLLANGAKEWDLVEAKVGDLWKQPQLADLLKSLCEFGPESFYFGGIADEIIRAAQSHGGKLTVSDLAEQEVLWQVPISTSWNQGELFVQPPSSQGILLAIVAKWFEKHAHLFSEGRRSKDVEIDSLLEHLEIEATEAAFQFRNQVTSRGEALLESELDVNFDHPSGRGGPRSYLHTSGIAVTDSTGMTVSSLVSVFDDFGSGVFVPGLGITLNNRAEGFTSGDNSYATNSYPVHTLAPSILVSSSGESLALATPGADGQIQTLIQILINMRFRDRTLVEAIADPRWRSEDGKLLIENNHQRLSQLESKGYRVEPLAPGNDVFGAVVATGFDSKGPFSAGDFRRQVSAGAL